MPWTVAHQAPLSKGFYRKEYWSGLPFPSPGDLLTQGWNLHLFISLALAGVLFMISTTWEVLYILYFSIIFCWVIHNFFINTLLVFLHECFYALENSPSTIYRLLSVSLFIGNIIFIMYSISTIFGGLFLISYLCITTSKAIQLNCFT